MIRRFVKAVKAVKAAKPPSVPPVFLAWCLLVGTACNFSFSTPIAANEPVAPTRLVLATKSTPVPVPASAAAVSSLDDAISTDNPAIPSLVPSLTLPAGSTPALFADPVGCQRPPDNYARLRIGSAKLNARTLWMLKHAQALYKGTLNFTGWGITQGSYNPGGVAASFGTHDAGGAVDLSVRNPRTGQVMWNEIPAAIQALRITGFAAWLRDVDELYPGSPIHIHAIAIGDAELSPAARDQLTGTFGYFRGYNGLPRTDNIPGPDRHGGPVFCQWMLDMGYRDLRQP